MAVNDEKDHLVNDEKYHFVNDEKDHLVNDEKYRFTLFFSLARIKQRSSAPRFALTSCIDLLFNA